MATIPLTRRGAEKLKEELQRLKSVERHAVIQAISEARAQGDLSENAEYEAAKDKQGFIEGRILEIEGKLAAAQIIDPANLHAEGKVDANGTSLDATAIGAGRPGGPGDGPFGGPGGPRGGHRGGLDQDGPGQPGGAPPTSGAPTTSSAAPTTS